MASAALPPVLRVATLRAIEQRYRDLPLMERAGRAAADTALAYLGGQRAPVVVLAGPGNNGGDGFVVARLLRERFQDVVVVFVGDAARLPKDAAAAYQAYRASGATTTVEAPPSGDAALVVDAMFGIGLARPLAAPYPAWIQWANTRNSPVLSLDNPTGLDADTGSAFMPAIRATATATFIALKPGLLTHFGVDLCGSITVHDLGIPVEAEGPAKGHWLRWPSLASSLPASLLRREANAHKGTFGTLSIIGGASGMVGAPLLAARAAVRCGTGKVRVGFVAQDAPAVDDAMPETMLRAAPDALAMEATALVIGCGLGTASPARDALAAGLRATVPVVLDADALNLIAADSGLRALVGERSAATIATPHPAEAARLLQSDTATVQSNRLEAALRLAGDLRADIVLKGAGTVLAHPDGTFDINGSGNVGLASGGTGDVLAGMVGALLAQGIDAKSASRLGVCLHGAAADRLVASGIGPLGIGASELPDAARALLNDAARGAGADY